ncbi:MAG TPA: glucose-6-phosphate dehydrogenase, partial [Candidatus Kapabacteria bacterium]|nr:glucose-6-phosphate dehydrogenase [Candidatus Kapabacteria bacterium]
MNLADIRSLRNKFIMTKEAEPAIITIFGATGDLAHRMVLPALYEIEAAGQLPKGTMILGI